MGTATDYVSYASKMRGLAVAGVDLEADARFVDMVSPRRAHVLDLGCGIGAAVNALRKRGHDAFGIDPSEHVLKVAADLFDSAWYRQSSAERLSPDVLKEHGLPSRYDCVLMAGNVPAFLPPCDLQAVFNTAVDILTAAGHLIIGTSTYARGGPQDQDSAAQSSGLILQGRYSTWHLDPFDKDPWCVSVYAAPGTRVAPDGPDGQFILPASGADGGPTKRLHQ